MRPRDYIPLALLAGIAGLIVVQGLKNKRDIPRQARRGETTSVALGSDAGATTSVGTDTATAAIVRPSGEPARARDLAAIQAQIKDGAPGTYLLDMLAEQHDTLMHWPQRRIDALRVWIDRYPGLPDFEPSYPVVAEHVFEEWHEAGFPLRFDFVPEASAAEIVIRWVATLPPGDTPRIGSTVKTRDENGWITAAEILISTHDRETGKPLSAALVAGIARHEVGHALGLGHSNNRADVMFPESSTPVISRADRATLHLLYILPPGPVK